MNFYFNYIWLGYLIMAILIPRLLLERREPGPQIAWILMIIFFPVFGFIFYLFFGGHRIVRKTRKKLHTSKAFLEGESRKEKVPTEPHIAKGFQRVVDLADRLTNGRIHLGTQLETFSDAQETFNAMLSAMRQAKEFIYLETYIFQPDAIGREFLKVLTQKAQEGVEVKLLIDRIGSLMFSKVFFRTFIAAGGRVEFFETIHFGRAIFNPHFRNHRKILVVDGQVGFTGGINIGKSFLKWYDLHLRIEGDVVNDLQDIFAEDWYFTAQEILSTSRVFKGKTNSHEITQIVHSWPDYMLLPLGRVLLAAIQTAQESIQIITPYFVPDVAMKWALLSAADRGVKVQILIPKKSDHRTLTWASWSYLEEMVACNIEIFLYPGMIHAKLLMIDGYFVSIGSANMDTRSFHYNYETNVMIYSTHQAKIFLQKFQSLCERARNMDLKTIQSWPLGKKLLINTIQLFSPLL